MAYDRLSPLDSVFLHVENEHQPLHVGALSYFERGPLLDDEGRFDLARVRRHIESRLHLVPRFRKRIMTVPFEQGRPIWVDDPDFDLAYHVRLTAIPAPGNEAQVKLLMDRVQAQMLDRRRPLWELWFVEGVSDDRVALIQKTHHALVDGVSGVDVATVLLDITPDAVDTEPPPWEAQRPPDAATLLIDSLLERASEPAELVRSARAVVRGPQKVVERATQVARAALDMSPSIPRAPWNVPVTPHRRFEPARVDIDRAKALRRAAVALGDDLASTTLNDIVLTACSGALRRYLLDRGDDVPDGVVFKAMVPVSVRAEEEQLALGNRVSAITADLPVGEADPLERLRFVHAHMVSRKEMGTAVGVDTIIGAATYAPPTMLSLASRLAVRAMPVNTVITNVPGPQFPLYCMGSRMLEAFPYVCVVDRLAMIIAVLSYDGQLGFGLSGDRSAVPDLVDLAAAIETGFAELEAVLLPGAAGAGAKGAKAATGATTTKGSRTKAGAAKAGAKPAASKAGGSKAAPKAGGSKASTASAAKGTARRTRPKRSA